MQKKFADTMKELRGLINEWSAPCRQSGECGNAGILLAVSGGIDSMCMAELFAAMEPEMPFAIAHCNFHLRGEESDGDEQFVKDWASGHGVKCHTTSFDTESFARTRGISIEMAARELRYDWFARLCSEYGYAAVAVAHNANDNAETLVLNLLRGSGIKGLSGMSVIASLPNASSLPLLRPLLRFTRKQIEAYMLINRYSYREDSTNASSDYKRNRIRNEVFPIFEKVNPSFVRTLNREMGYFDEAGEIVGHWCRQAALPIVKGNCIDTKALLKEKHWKYLLYHILEPYGFNTSTLESLEALLLSGRTVSGKRFESDEYVLLTERDRMIICRNTEHPDRQDEAGVEIFTRISAPGVYHINGRRITVEVQPWRKDMPLKQPEGVLIMDAARLRFPFVMRMWREGDWMIPLGMRGRKKISDLFADLKYGHAEKSAAIILVDCAGNLAEQQHIAAVVGVRMDDRYKVTDNTETIIKITII